MNVLFKSHIKLCDDKYNFTLYSNRGYITKTQIENAKIVHYNLPNKPLTASYYNSRCDGSDLKLFWKYAKIVIPREKIFFFFCKRFFYMLKAIGHLIRNYY